MDYDRTEIPARYDRARSFAPEVLALWMDVVASALAEREPLDILDLGCGTGRFAEALADRFRADVTAVDPSHKMLVEAQRKRGSGRVRYQLGAAEQLPLEDGSVDLVFLSMVFHHLRDRRKAARECKRVLRPEGTLFVRTPTRERSYAITYFGFFPRARTLYEQRMPRQAEVIETFERAGVRLVAQRTVQQEIAPSYHAYAERLALKGDSILASLESHEFEAGLRALRAYASAVEDRAITEPLDVFVFQRGRS